MPISAALQGVHLEKVKDCAEKKRVKRFLHLTHHPGWGAPPTRMRKIYDQKMYQVWK